MRRCCLIALFACSAVACGDDSEPAETGTTSSSTTGEATGSTSDAPTTDAPTTGSSSSGEPTSGSSTTDDSTTDATMGSSSTGDGAESSTGDAGVFSVTSPAFAEGELFPFNMHISEGNVHPQLDWTSPPAGTMSYGVFFEDLSISFGHSVIWNIPADATGLPEAIEAEAMPASVPGALQAEHWAGGVGYGGPGSCENVYEFTVYALDVANLDDEVSANSDRFTVRASLEAHSLGTATLSGQTRGSTAIPGCTPVRE